MAQSEFPAPSFSDSAQHKDPEIQSACAAASSVSLLGSRSKDRILRTSLRPLKVQPAAATSAPPYSFPSRILQLAPESLLCELQTKHRSQRGAPHHSSSPIPSPLPVHP